MPNNTRHSKRNKYQFIHKINIPSAYVTLHRMNHVIEEDFISNSITHENHVLQTYRKNTSIFLRFNWKTSIKILIIRKEISTRYIQEISGHNPPAFFLQHVFVPFLGRSILFRKGRRYTCTEKCSSLFTRWPTVLSCFFCRIFIGGNMTGWRFARYQRRHRRDGGSA